MTPFTDRRGQFSPLKTLTLAALAAPALFLAATYLAGSLGPLPAKEALLVSGTWAIRFVVLGLALTPAQRILAWPRLALVRRMTGVAAFLYAALHVALYAATLKFDAARIAGEIASRPYLVPGLLALTGLAALAATSTDAALHRLGRHWKSLHRTVYGIAALGLLHFALQAKIDASPAFLLAGLFALLLFYRLLLRLRRPATPVALAVTAAAAAATTVAAEGLWYAVATRLDPWTIVLANFRPDYGLRPAGAVLIAGLAVTGLAAWPAARHWAVGRLSASPGRNPPQPKAGACVCGAPVLDNARTRP